MAMESRMNCFECQNQISDYLDQTLDKPTEKNIENHLKECKTCKTRLDHFHTILTALADQKKRAIPESLQKTPLSRQLPRPEAIKLRFDYWEFIPWYIRVLFQSTTIIAIVMLGVSSAPRIRKFYERKIEKNLAEFKESFGQTTGFEDDEHNLPSMEKSVSFAESHLNPEKTAEEINGETDTEEEGPSHGKSYLWRFILKTVSPDELRPSVIKMITDLGVAQDIKGLGGMQVPGGIEFDLVLAQSLVSNLKDNLKKLAPETETQGNEIFTWYRVKSKKKLPDGKSQVVIWLAQPF